MPSLDKCLDILRAASIEPFPIAFDKDKHDLLMFCGEYSDGVENRPIKLEMWQGRVLFRDTEHLNNCQNLISAKLIGYGLK